MVCTYRIAVQMHEIYEALPLQEKYNRSSSGYYYNYDNLHRYTSSNCQQIS